MQAHSGAYEYIGGVPAITVPDNLKAGVIRPDFYDPELNPGYRELAAHYGSTIIARTIDVAFCPQAAVRRGAAGAHSRGVLPLWRGDAALPFGSLARAGCYHETARDTYLLPVLDLDEG